MKAVLRRVRISPKKANLVAGMVRGKKVEEALNLLDAIPKKAARILYKVVHSAASNATNNFKQSIGDLFITRLLVTKGPTLKRSRPVSRGRTHPILKRMSHITVEVGVAQGAEAKTHESAKREEKSKEALKSGKQIVPPVAQKTEATEAKEKAVKEAPVKNASGEKKTAKKLTLKKSTKS
ncbi:MAG: 50S ribosomal protein L22 [Candidatus Peregrinibacteria bacterium]